jgi:lipopolysaccharide/colanic/teichoic acid biosynthesis glycosyltransferase
MLKRLFDIAVSATLLLVFLPLLALTAVLVWLDSGGPVLFSQARVGRGGHWFRIWKLRSMQNSNSGSPITKTGDPRITRIGKVLRATKLDELPQFWNVLKGDMSLVGPRPEIPEYVELFASRYNSILAVRPGITDPASIALRNEEELLARAPDSIREYAERVLPYKLALAEEYVATMSFRSDIAILMRTFWVIVHPQHQSPYNPDQAGPLNP